MKWLEVLLQNNPMLALFVTIALGYFCGKLKVGKFVLGGVAGTLIVGVLIGQLHIPIDDKLKETLGFLFLEPCKGNASHLTDHFGNNLAVNFTGGLFALFAPCTLDLGFFIEQLLGLIP